MAAREYDEAATRRLLAVYVTPDVVAQRAALLRAFGRVRDHGGAAARGSRKGPYVDGDPAPLMVLIPSAERSDGDSVSLCFFLLDLLMLACEMFEANVIADRPAIAGSVQHLARPSFPSIPTHKQNRIPRNEVYFSGSILTDRSESNVFDEFLFVAR
jgi:hypothetical protein